MTVGQICCKLVPRGIWNDVPRLRAIVPLPISSGYKGSHARNIIPYTPHDELTTYNII
jgi:hypothetical protein